MKTHFLLAAGVLLACSALAQTQKGNGILSGGVRLGYTTNKDDGYRSSNIHPQVNVQAGRFIADNWMVGVSLSYSGQYSRYRFTTNGITLTRANRINSAISPFFRRYWSVGPVLVFAGAGIQANLSKSSEKINYLQGAVSSFDGTSSLFNTTVEVGGTYFLSNRIALQGVVSAIGLPIPASNVGLGIVYWTGSTGSGKDNPESTLSTTQLGNWVIEGGIGGGSSRQVTVAPTRNTDVATDNASINASIGRFIADNLLLGVGLGFSSEKSDSSSPFGPNQTYSINPFVQKYLTNRRLTPFARATVLYSSSGATGIDDRIKSIQGVLAMGLAYRISNRFLAETSLGNISYQLLRFDEENKIHAVNLAAQLGSNFSLRYVIAGQR